MLAVGDDEASSLGVRAARVRLVVVAAATLATAAAVAVTGLIGFVGIIVPHTIRLLAGSSHRLLAPLSLVAGAAFLILADLAARTVMAPAELPIGVVTAIVGAPFFALVLRDAAAGPMTGIELRGVSVALDGRPVPRDLTLAIPRGARLGLIGPNGSGKTTLLRAIAGLVPHTGELRVGDAAGGPCRAGSWPGGSPWSPSTRRSRPGSP